MNSSGTWHGRRSSLCQIPSKAKMKVHLHIHQLQVEEAYTSLDPIRGSVNLRLWHSTPISEVVLLLKGKIRTITVEGGPRLGTFIDTSTIGDDSHNVLTVSKTLFPHDGEQHLVLSGQRLEGGTYQFPFEIAFPLLSTCQESQPGARHVTATLPPSFKAQHSHRGATDVVYFLEVQVKRPGLLHQARALARRQLEFVPPDPPLSRIWARSGGCTASQTLYVDRSPPLGKLPLLALKVKLPSPVVLYSDETLLLQLSVWRFPVPASHLSPVTLQSLAVVLHCRTMLTPGSGCSGTSWTSPSDLLRLTGIGMELASAQDEEQVLHLDSLSTIVAPRVAPSFTTCTVKRDYWVDVTAGLSLGDGGRVKLLKVAVNVEMHSGRTLEPAPAAHALHVPLRVDFLQHLRAGTGAAAAEEPLPPYTPQG
ncbi:hypothetical protein B0I37DRAFT_158988 [Chaetomium sp. MPI-CAGE-AT-0009]|nr:hypothetical protein B0I37DRAFT_158988 [Chaetomium sp. MPI-CAGE-AT-0009]